MNDKLLIDRTLLEQALDALLHRRSGSDQVQRIDAAITDLCAALAQQPEPVQELVAPAMRDAAVYGVGISRDGKRIAPASIYAQPEPVQEPVAVVRSVVGQGDEGVRIKWLGGFPQIGDPLYTTPPQRPPLTDEEIRAHADKHLRYQPQSYEASGVFDLVRAIERKVRGE